MPLITFEGVAIVSAIIHRWFLKVCMISYITSIKWAFQISSFILFVTYRSLIAQSWLAYNSEVSLYLCWREFSLVPWDVQQRGMFFLLWWLPLYLWSLSCFSLSSVSWDRGLSCECFLPIPSSLSFFFSSAVVLRHSPS